ncbi:MAG TPA: T9SS type A sorting domain-containing protein, partial [Bacteroidetes bacterium]|nr:T9SS type A sorting domain-containing protein [Bacteroidota bacterium]
DIYNNTATCTATVTVLDDLNPCCDAPEAICQNAVAQLDANGNASITAADVDGGSLADCGLFSLSVSPFAFDCNDLGSNVVTLTVTDINNDSDQCTAMVTVEDNIPPVALCQDATIQLDASGNGSIGTAAIDAGTSDNCSFSLSLSQTAFDCSHVGANQVTLTATDPSTNSHSCTATVTVQDNVPPIALCQDVTVQLDANGSAAATGAAINNGSADACGIASLSASPNVFACAEVGANAVVLTVTDANGNPADCAATVTVEDNVPPLALCQDITVQLDANGSASIAGGDIDNGSNDACGIASLSASPNMFDCSNIGANSVALTVVDVNGNSSTCSATVTIGEFIIGLSIVATPESCAGTTDGSITISASTTGGQLEYSIDGGLNFNLTGVYVNLSAGTYSIVVRVAGIATLCEVTGTGVVAAGGSPQTWYKDWDGDGYSDGITQSSCSQPTGYFLPADLNGLNNDCNDYDASEHPGQTWYQDADNDGYSDGTSQTACLRPPGGGYKTAAELASLDIDCDDSDPAVHPGAAEVCNGIDDNCNGSIDEGVGSGLTWTGNVAFYTQAQVDAWLACYSVIDGSLTIAGAGITNLTALAGLEEVTGNVTIQFTGLTNMAGLGGLTTVGGTLTIYFNSSLTSLDGLGSLASVGGSLMVYYNFALADCCAVHGLINGGVMGTVLIFFNKTGCNTVAEINSNCGSQLLAPPVPGVFNNVPTCADCGIADKKLELAVFPNPASGEVSLRLNKLAVDGADVQFYDYLGRLVALQKMPAGAMLLKVDVAEGKFRPGEYFIKVKTGSEVATGRLRIIR